MAEGNDDSSSSSNVSSCASLNVENYSQLLQAFKETHEEANQLALLNNRLKRLNNDLKTSSRHLKNNWKIQKLILKILKCITKSLLVCVTQKLVKIVKLLRVKSTIL